MNQLRYILVFVLSLVGVGANAATVVVNYAYGQHIGPWLVGGSNGATPNVVYGDGANFGVAPQNKCIDGSTQTCSSLGKVAGDNGTYQTNVGAGSPTAFYNGQLSYDDAVTFNYYNSVTNTTESYYKINGGALSWTGTYGTEVLVAAGGSGKVGGSFFDYSFANGNVNLLTGTRTSTAKCDLGIAGGAVVGPILCGAANPASGYGYASTGTYVKPTDWTGIRILGNGEYELLMYGNRYSSTGSGNNLQETMYLSSVVPIPGAVWLMSSALGLLGWLRRKALVAA